MVSDKFVTLSSECTTIGPHAVVRDNNFVTKRMRLENEEQW